MVESNFKQERPQIVGLGETKCTHNVINTDIIYVADGTNRNLGFTFLLDFLHTIGLFCPVLAQCMSFQTDGHRSRSERSVSPKYGHRLSFDNLLPAMANIGPISIAVSRGMLLIPHPS